MNVFKSSIARESNALCLGSQPVVVGHELLDKERLFDQALDVGDDVLARERQIQDALGGVDRDERHAPALVPVGLSLLGMQRLHAAQGTVVQRRVKGVAGKV